MTYQEQTQANATAARTAVLTLLAAHEMGEISPDELAALTTTTVLRANSRAVVLADLGLTGLLSAMRRVAVPHLGLTLPASERDRLDKAVITTLAGRQEDYAHRLGRLASAEPLETGRQAWHEAMAVHGVKTWTRKARSGACELCTSLADGTVLPVSTRMADHPGCGCVAVPSIEDRSPRPGLSFRTVRPVLRSAT